jgi:type II secretory pathway component GspD/PulD (secretin)
MIRAFAICAMLLATTVARADEEPRLVDFSVVIATGPAEKFRPEAGVAATKRPDGEPGSSELLAKVSELEKAGDLTSITRLQFSAIENEQVRLQFGESVSVVTGRTGPSGRGTGTPFGGNTSGFPGGSVSLSREQTGTLVAAIARIIDGNIVAQLEIEQTRLQPKGGAEEAVVSPGANTLSVKSAVRIPNGATVVLAGLQDRNAGDNRRTLILVSATVPDGADGKRSDVSVLKVFALKNANAEDLRSLFVQLYPDAPMSVAADERTNSLIVRGSHDQLSIVEALALRLDDVNRVEKR